MSARMSHSFQCPRIAVLMIVIIVAVAIASPRKTFAGGTCRSAIAPNNSGEMNAAIAAAANAKGLMFRKPCASRIAPSGTNQMDIAAA